jgi:hypothetical protein
MELRGVDGPTALSNRAASCAEPRRLEITGFAQLKLAQDAEQRFQDAGDTIAGRAAVWKTLRPAALNL